VKWRRKRPSGSRQLALWRALCGDIGLLASWPSHQPDATATSKRLGILRTCGLFACPSALTGRGAQLPSDPVNQAPRTRRLNLGYLLGMAKLRDAPISAKDLADFATTSSDFGFEMQVLTRLRAGGFSCSHSGTYRDPVTAKIRQFDIRASADRDDSTLALAVECKNLRPNNPLLLSAVPRTSAEAFHDLLVCRPLATYTQFLVQPVAKIASAYKPGEMVGKNTDQVGKVMSGELVSDDEATFDKLNQAVNSCQDLVRTFSLKVDPPLRRAIVPVLVVPTGLLWQVEYDADGTITMPPHQVKRSALFLDHPWTAMSVYGDPISYRLSHIEMVTFEALTGIAELWLGPGGFFPP